MKRGPLAYRGEKQLRLTDTPASLRAQFIDAVPIPVSHAETMLIGEIGHGQPVKTGDTYAHDSYRLNEYTPPPKPPIKPIPPTGLFRTTDGTRFENLSNAIDYCDDLNNDQYVAVTRRVFVKTNGRTGRWQTVNANGMHWVAQCVWLMPLRVNQSVHVGWQPDTTEPIYRPTR